MGQIIKSVCVCQCVSVSVCEHSRGRISWSIFIKIGTDNQKEKRIRYGSILQHPFPHFVFQDLHFGPRGPENPSKYQVISYICLKCMRIAEIFAHLRKSGSRNTTVTSDFETEVEIRPFGACAMKNMQYNLYLWPNRRNSRVLQEIGVAEHDGDVRFKSGSGYMAVSCMRNASGHNYRNSSVIVDLAMGQIPRSTERISS